MKTNWATEAVQDLYTENYKTSLKEIKDLKNGKAFHVHYPEDLPYFAMCSVHFLPKFLRGK